MPLLRMITALAGKDYVLQAGAVVDKPQKIAAAWVKAGIAEELSSPGSSVGTPPSKRTRKATSAKQKRSTKR